MRHLTAAWATLGVQTGPLIVYPAADGKGKWHAANRVTGTAACGKAVLLDTGAGGSIHVQPGQTKVHPIVCRQCLAASGWQP